MSYTLQDFLQALQQQQQQQQQQRRGPPPGPPPLHGRFGGRSPPYGYGPFGYFDDEDSEDQFTSARYPEYYSSFGFPGGPGMVYGRPYGGAYRAHEQPQQQQQQPESEEPAIPQNMDLEDILNLLAGGQPSSAQETPAEPADVAVEESQKKETKDEPKTAPKAESKPQTKSQTKPKVAPKPVFSKPAAPSKRHSTSVFKEPEPKVEISQRNVTNSQLPYSPQTSVYETGDVYTVVLALPGAQLKNLDIDFHPSTNEIVVKGVIPEPFDISTAKVNELRTGSIERRVKFPATPKIHDDAIKAKYLNGLLTIIVPKVKEDEKPKRKVTIEEVPDDELIYEQHGGIIE